MVTVCAPIASAGRNRGGPIPREEFGRHIQLVVTDNQPDAEKTQQGVAGERQWRVNDLGAKHDLLREACAGGTCGDHTVAEGKTSLEWNTPSNSNGAHGRMRPLTFMICSGARYSFPNARHDSIGSLAILSAPKGKQPALRLTQALKGPQLGGCRFDRLVHSSVKVAHSGSTSIEERQPAHRAWRPWVAAAAPTWPLTLATSDWIVRPSRVGDPDRDQARTTVKTRRRAPNAGIAHDMTP